MIDEPIVYGHYEVPVISVDVQLAAAEVQLAAVKAQLATVEAANAALVAQLQAVSTTSLAAEPTAEPTVEAAP